MSEPKGSLADVIRENRDEIVERFVRETARRHSPGGLARPLLADHIPTFVEKVARELAASPSLREAHGAVSAKALAREHGEQRWSLGFDLEGLTREYGLLRRCILAIATDAGIIHADAALRRVVERPGAPPWPIVARWRKDD